MRFAVTSQNFRTVTPHAGRTRRFLVYQAEAGGEPMEVERLDLPPELSLHEWHGDGAHPLDTVQVVIAGSFGDGFARRMAARGIVAVRTDETDPVAAVRAYLSGALTGTPVGAGGDCGCGGDGHGHGHGHRHAP